MNCNHSVELLPKIEEIRAKAEDVCPVDWAKRVADIGRMNNCGKTVMCRDGLNQLWNIINDITIDKGEAEDLELIRDICEVLMLSEGCELSKTAASLINESLSLYYEEWNAHLKRKRCSARVCAVLAANMPAPAVRQEGETTRRRRRKSE